MTLASPCLISCIVVSIVHACSCVVATAGSKNPDLVVDGFSLEGPNPFQGTACNSLDKTGIFTVVVSKVFSSDLELESTLKACAPARPPRFQSPRRLIGILPSGRLPVLLPDNFSAEVPAAKGCF